MEIKKNTLILVAAVFAVLVFGAVSAVVLSGNSETEDKNLGGENTNSGEVQNVKLTFENYEYKLEPSTLKKNVPVRMEVDLESVDGCMRDIVISAFKVKKYVDESDNIVEFTPNKAGTFGIACSMNMGRGKFVVVEQDGSKSDYVDSNVKAQGTAGSSNGGTCGMGGGCGCGMKA